MQCDDFPFRDGDRRPDPRVGRGSRGGNRPIWDSLTAPSAASPRSAETQGVQSPDHISTGRSLDLLGVREDAPHTAFDDPSTPSPVGSEEAHRNPQDDERRSPSGRVPTAVSRVPVGHGTREPPVAEGEEVAVRVLPVQGKVGSAHGRSCSRRTASAAVELCGPRRGGHRPPAERARRSSVGR